VSLASPGQPAVGRSADPAVPGKAAVLAGLRVARRAHTRSAPPPARCCGILPARAQLYTPAVANGILYAGFQSGTIKARLLALRAAHGKAKVLWQSPIIGLGQSWPAVADGLVYAGDTYGDVDAFNATTGKLAWQFPTPSGAGVEATPVVAHGIVYDSAEDDTLYALGATTGQKLATFPLGTATISAATVTGGAVYIGNYDQRLYALALPASAP
jgi:outer membrane protein assembly factor BamB